MNEQTMKKTIDNQHKVIITLRTQHALDEMEIKESYEEINRLNDIISDLNHIIEKMM